MDGQANVMRLESGGWGEWEKTVPAGGDWSPPWQARRQGMMSREISPSMRQRERRRRRRRRRRRKNNPPWQKIAKYEQKGKIYHDGDGQGFRFYEIIVAKDVQGDETHTDTPASLIARSLARSLALPPSHRTLLCLSSDATRPAPSPPPPTSLAKLSSRACFGAL